ncbi:hypothetical protein [Eleftheria terrae]|uniref:hypothetical protein n=1 Tax=Eleftheria terrae TaxID=1597781 RepID=UPI00263BCF4D|nr:hypothetical protein [Eleftheria terrae]WKB56025.1 hypothetical protein N7L95_28575 [Eleftheria terrae]
MNATIFLGTAAVLAIVWLIFRPSSAKRAEGETSSNWLAPELSEEAFHWPRLGGFEFEVVGESQYQEALAAVAGDHGTDSVERECLATLLPEDDNRFDPKAVAVLIGRRKVGHLSREDARSFRRRLAQKRLSNATTCCAALVVGGATRRTGEKLHYGLRLDIKPFD